MRSTDTVYVRVEKLAALALDGSNVNEAKLAFGKLWELCGREGLSLQEALGGVGAAPADPDAWERGFEAGKEAGREEGKTEARHAMMDFLNEQAHAQYDRGYSCGYEAGQKDAAAAQKEAERKAAEEAAARPPFLKRACQFFVVAVSAPLLAYAAYIVAMQAGAQLGQVDITDVAALVFIALIILGIVGSAQDEARKRRR